MSSELRNHDTRRIAVSRLRPRRLGVQSLNRSRIQNSRPLFCPLHALWCLTNPASAFRYGKILMCQRHRCSDVPECVAGVAKPTPKFHRDERNSPANAHACTKPAISPKRCVFTERFCAQSSPIPGSLCARISQLSGRAIWRGGTANERGYQINPGMAEAYYIKAAATSPGSHRRCAHCFRLRGGKQAALRRALVNRGSALMALNRHNEALEDFRKVIAVNPNIAGVWSNCGGILLNLNRHEEALAYFDERWRSVRI